MYEYLTPTPKSAYDYSKLIKSAKENTQYQCFTTYISEKIDAYRQMKYYGEAHRFPRKKLAEEIGINASTLMKIINGSQKTRKRDLIIAICFVLQMSSEETSLALALYPMVPLNCNNLRDLVISQARDDRLSVEELNYVLEKHGFPKLDLLRSKHEKEILQFYYPVKNLAFDEVSVTIQPYCIAGDDYRCSLHERYRIDNYNYHSEMIIRSRNEPDNIFRIVLEDQHYEVSQQERDVWNLRYSNMPSIEKRFHVSPCEDSDLLNEIAILQNYTDQKARYVHTICADTRNYTSRFDAINNNGHLVIYGEIFGSDAPEQCEYYQIEISTQKCLFTVSDHSRLMERYLGNEDWMRLYGVPLPPVNHSFTSLESILNSRWRSYYQVLQESANVLLEQLQERRLFLFNARAFLDIEQLLSFYNVEEAFDCIRVDDIPYQIAPQKDSIQGSDGRSITVDDLYRAAELDIHSVEELCNIRKRYGSLEGLLKNDMLTERKGNKNE